MRDPEWSTPDHGQLDEHGRLLYGGRPLDVSPWRGGDEGFKTLVAVLVWGRFIALPLEPGDGTRYNIKLSVDSDLALTVSLNDRSYATVNDVYEVERAARELATHNKHTQPWTERLMRHFLVKLTPHLWGPRSTLTPDQWNALGPTAAVFLSKRAGVVGLALDDLRNASHSAKLAGHDHGPFDRAAEQIERRRNERGAR